VSTVLACALLVQISAVRADTCPSIDSWLELIRERGGQHRLLDAAELSRTIDVFERLADVQRHPWTSAIVTAFPDGSGLVLLNVNTSVCGIIDVPPNRWPVLRRTIILRSS
jgi:hypothetical protein